MDLVLQLLFTGIGIIVITAERLFRLLTGRITEAEINSFGGDHDHSLPEGSTRGHQE